MIWATLLAASLLYIVRPVNCGRLLDQAHHVLRMSVNRDPVSIILMLEEHILLYIILTFVHFQYMMG